MRDATATDAARGAVAFAGVALVVLAAVGAVAAPAAAGPAGSVAQEDCSYPVTLTDATGTEVSIEEEPDSVVALAPSAAQILWAIGAQEKVVGMPVDYHTGYLNDTEGRTNVMDARANVLHEAVVGTEADLVLAPGVIAEEDVRTLRDAGLTVYKFDTAASLDDVYEKIERYGRLIGNYDEAGRASAEMQGQVEAVEEAVADEENPRVYFDLGFGWTSSEDSFIGDIIATAGGDNIAAGELEGQSGELSEEVIAEKDPEWIVVNGKNSPMTRNAAINESTAVQEGNIVRVTADFMSQNGPKNVEPLKTIASALHSEAYESVDFDAVETPEPVACATPTATPTATPSPTATATPTASPTDADGGATTATDATTEAGGDATETDAPETPGADTETTSDDGPGFTAASGLVAALVAALLVRRRR